MVLPFSSLGESESFAAAVGEGLISKLIQMEDLRVVAWNSTLRLKATPRDYARLGDQLNVHGVVEGSVAPVSDDRIRVAAQLIDVQDGAYLWTESFERSTRRNRFDPRLHRRRSRPSPASPLRVPHFEPGPLADARGSVAAVRVCSRVPSRDRAASRAGHGGDQRPVQERD